MAIRDLNRLTASEVESAKDGRLSDGGGLHLRVGDNGPRRRWGLSLIRNGKATEIGLGAADAVTLAKAREERKAAAYDRAASVERRRPVTQAWADHCDSVDADNVVAFERRAGSAQG
jgi:hypothetical protein